MTVHKLDLIVACDAKRGIAKNGSLPWRLPGDMKYFTQMTTSQLQGAPPNIVIMGRRTWQSLPTKFRPLPKRRNIVLTRHAESLSVPAEVVIEPSLSNAVEFAYRETDQSRCFVIGGADVYEQAMNEPTCDLLYLTQIEAEFDCDVFLPAYDDRFILVQTSDVQEENGIAYRFKVFQRKKA